MNTGEEKPDNYEIIVEWFDCGLEVSHLRVWRLRSTFKIAKARAKQLMHDIWCRKVEGGNIPEHARIELAATEEVVARFEWNQDSETAQETRL